MSLANASASISNSKRVSNAWATLFNIRVGVSEAEQCRLLGARHCGCNESLTPEEGIQRLWHLLMGRSVSQVLKFLAVVSMFFAPVPLSVEPSCKLDLERSVALGSRAVHMSFSIVYVVLSFSRWWIIRWRIPIALRRKGFQRLHMYLDIASLGGFLAEIILIKPRHAGAYHWAQILWLLHLLKAWRVLGESALTSAELRGLTLQIITLFLELVFAAHSFACAFLALANYEARNDLSTWMDKLIERGGQQSCMDFYMAALYFSTYTLTSIGYGDLYPVNVLEHSACVVFMLGSQMFAAKIFADLTWITTTHKYWTTQHHTRLTQTATALDSMGVHADLYERVMAYQDFIEEEQKERRAQEILRDLSRPLREELRLVVHYDLVSQAPFLQAQPTFLVRNIISSLNDVVYLPCDVIIRLGDVGDELFFLRSGQAGVFTSETMPNWDDSEVLVLRNGAYFGEVAILTGQPRSSWVIARTYCICSVLPKHVIDNIMADNPCCIAGLVASLKSVLKLKPATTWKEISKRIHREFDDDAPSEDQVYDFTCSGEDGEAPAGLITWGRFNILMQRLHICPLDRKLFWVELDHKSEGVVDFSYFWDAVSGLGSEHGGAGTGTNSLESMRTQITTESLPTLMNTKRPENNSIKGTPATAWAKTGEEWQRFGSLHGSTGPSPTTSLKSLLSTGSNLSAPRRVVRRKSSYLSRATTSDQSGVPSVVVHADAQATASQDRAHADILAQLASLTCQVRQLTAHSLGQPVGHGRSPTQDGPQDRCNGAVDKDCHC